MPPKKDSAASEVGTLLIGFENREAKLLAAAFMSCIGPDKYDYDIMAALTGNTSGSLKNMWPPVKKKAIDTYPSFAAFLGATPAPTDGGTKAAPAAAAKGATTRKRKAAEPDVAEEVAAEGEAKSASDGNKSDGKKKKAPAKPRAKKVKKEEVEEEVGKNNEGDEGLSEEKQIEEEM